VYELEASTSAGRNHITSLRPIRPQNAPDPWEAEALRAFGRGETEVSSIETLGGQSYMRLMRPLVTEEACLQCHKEQGYRVGDIRGGISVSVPLAPLQAISREHVVSLSVGHGLLWLFGLGGIGLGARHLAGHLKARHHAEEMLRENVLQLQTMAERNARLKAEQAMLATEEQLRLARQIQEGILPTAAPSLPGFEISGVSYPADAASGDFYDYLPLPNGSLGIVIADVSGHGIAPALLAAETCAYLHAWTEACPERDDILSRLNQFLVRFSDDNYFVTMFFARLDPHRRSLVFSGAGHQAYLFHASGAVQVLKSTSMPLGISADTAIPWSAPVALEPGQVVIFLTDGILEAPAPGGGEFGFERVRNVVSANFGESAETIAELLCTAAREFSSNQPQSDDMTVVVLKVAGDPSLSLPDDQEAAILRTQSASGEGEQEGDAGSL
jgi:serine phosphatase RsbU (regulator of sigma subunit)